MSGRVGCALILQKGAAVKMSLKLFCKTLLNISVQICLYISNLARLVNIVVCEVCKFILKKLNQHCANYTIN